MSWSITVTNDTTVPNAISQMPDHARIEIDDTNSGDTQVAETTLEAADG